MLTKDQINFLNDTCFGRWIENDNTIDSIGTIDMRNMELTQIPVQFGKIEGDYICSDNHLTTLIGGPFIVCGNYHCSNNNLTNLIGAPEICNSFWCASNQLTSLEGCPKQLYGPLRMYDNNNLLYLWGLGNNNCSSVNYDNDNEINEWIIECARNKIQFPYYTLTENVQWIKTTGLYSCLLKAPLEIRQHFSKFILNAVDNGLYIH